MVQILIQWMLATSVFVTCVNGLVSQPRITAAPDLARRQDAGLGFIGYVTTDGACKYLFTSLQLPENLTDVGKGMLSPANQAQQSRNQVLTLHASRQMLHLLS
jgi:hypothetical protein